MPIDPSLAIPPKPAAPKKKEATVYFYPSTLEALDSLADRLRRDRSDTLDRIVRKALGLPEVKS